MPTKRTKEGFDPNAYRLMAKAGSDHKKPSGLGKLIPETSGKEEHKVSKAKGFSVTSSKAGIGYTPLTPIHIPIRKASVLVILANYEEEEQSSNLSKKSSVFYRIGRPTSHISVFDKLGTQEDNSVVGTQGSIFTRLNHSTPSQVGTRGSVLTRLSHSIPSRLSKDLKAKRKKNERTNFPPRGVNDILIVDQDSNEIRSSIPSHMKRRTIWEVNTREALTVKRRTMVTTNQEVEDDVKDAPPIFEEGIQATVDELKEINTNTTKGVLRIGPINFKFLKRYYA